VNHCVEQDTPKTEKAPLVSVIVPVYNVERYLSQCIDSILGQTLQDFELLLVDDGSTDRSGKILAEYAEKDDRLRVLRQDNQYAGAARNNGLRHATGKYLLFLDSDDFFVPNMLELVCQHAEKYQAETVIFGYYKYDNLTQSVFGKWCPATTELFAAADLPGERLMKTFNAYPWNKLLLREFVLKNRLWFEETRRCNDTLFNYLAFVLSKRTVGLSQMLVYYRVNNADSLQGSIDSDRESYLRCGVSTVAELRSRGLFYGNIRDGFMEYSKVLVKRGLKGVSDFVTLQRYYDCAKACLVPQMFDSPADFEDDYFVSTLYASKNSMEFLLANAEEFQLKLFPTGQNRSNRLVTLLLKILRKLKNG